MQSHSSPVRHVDPVPDNNLATVAQYYLNPQHLTSLRTEGITQIVLIGVCITGIGLYVTSADTYAIQNYGAGNTAMRANFIIGTSTPALVVLYNTTDLFKNRRAAVMAPKVLASILKKSLTLTQSMIQDSAVFIGSALSAIPLTATSLIYPIPGPEWLVYLQAVFVQANNTMLHVLPIQLALREQIFRFPLLVVELPWNFIQEYRKSENQKQEDTIQRKKEEIYDEIRGRLIGTLLNTQNNIVISGMVFEATEFGYKSVLPDNLTKLVTDSTDPASYGFSKLEAVADYAVKTSRSSSSYIHKAMKRVAYGAGAAWVFTSGLGYLATTVNLLTSFAGTQVGIALAASPDYFLSVLLVFYGGIKLQETYEYFTSWEKDDIKIPLEFKLYPKSTLLLMLFAIYLAAFSYGTGAQLVNDRFGGEEWDTVRPIILGFVKSGMPFISFVAMLDFYKAIMNKFAMYFGGEDSMIAVKVHRMIANLVDGINLIAGADLIEALKHLDDSKLMKFINMTRAELQVKCDELASYDQVQSPTEHIDNSDDTESVTISMQRQNKRPSAFAGVTTVFNTSRLSTGPADVEIQRSRGDTADEETEALRSSGSPDSESTSPYFKVS